jgi:molybdopterin converting factor subunit 1
MLEPLHPTPPTPLPAILSRRYNPTVLNTTAPNSIRLTVLFFGRLREAIGHPEHSIEIAEGATIEDLFAHFAARHPELAAYRHSLAASRNKEFAAWTTLVHPGDEIAFLPPVSGG